MARASASLALLRACLVVLGCTIAAGPAGAQVLLSSAWADTVQLGEPDEAIEILNAGGTSLDLASWALADDDGGLVRLPAPFPLGPGERAWIARDGAAFTVAFGEAPAAEHVDTLAGAPQVSGTWPLLGNAGDEIRLLDAAGIVQDVLVYGNAVPSGAGWIGPGATAGYDPAFATQLLVTRDRVEASGDCVVDTDTASDWDDLRLERPGTTHHLPLRIESPGPVTAAIGPDGTFRLLRSVIEGAASTLRVQVYDLGNPAVISLLREAAQRGVRLTVLLEGEPVGGLDDDARWAASELATAGADVRWLRADAGEVKRYPFTHAKCVLADGGVTYVATENLSRTGHPADPTWGNRGWAMAVDDARVTSWHEALFDEDADLRHADVAVHDPMVDGPTPGFLPDAAVPAGWHSPGAGMLTDPAAVAVVPVVSPDHASMEENGVLGLLASAAVSIDTQQLSLPLHWGRQADDPALHPSPIVQGLIAAARRGVAVRVLLDASWFNVEPSDPRDNDDTCALLQATAASEGLPLSCRLLEADWLGLRTIHVKGFLVDGRIAHAGSMNGTSNSYRLNREVALQVESAPLTAWLGAEFQRDWIVAGVGARVPAEVTGVRVAKSGTGLRLSWDARPVGSPPADGWRVHAGSSVLSESSWTVAAQVAGSPADVAVPPQTVAYFLVTAVANGPGGSIEGPSGFGDGYLDR